jgi:hypothetical protein
VTVGQRLTLRAPAVISWQSTRRPTMHEIKHNVIVRRDGSNRGPVHAPRAELPLSRRRGRDRNAWPVQRRSPMPAALLWNNPHLGAEREALPVVVG